MLSSGKASTQFVCSLFLSLAGSFCLSKQDEPGLQWGCTAQANNWVTPKFNLEKTIVSSPVTQSFPIHDLTQSLTCSGDSPAGWNTAMLADWPGGVFSQWGAASSGNFRSHLWRSGWWGGGTYCSEPVVGKTAELPIACYQPSVYSLCSSIPTVARESFSRDQSTGSGWCYLEALEYQCVTKIL